MEFFSMVDFSNHITNNSNSNVVLIENYGWSRIGVRELYKLMKHSSTHGIR